MKRYEELVLNLIELDSEQEWLEFKENWYEPHALGEYISAISNAAAIAGKTEGYFIWGVNDSSHKIVGTNFVYQCDYKGEPLQHYLARNLTPSIEFLFNEIYIQEKRIVILTIPAAIKIPTAFDKDRYVRIGSSKENVAKYPEREALLFDILKNGLPSLINVESKYQDLKFEKLFTYYAGRGITLKTTTFKKNLNLLTKDNQFNMLALILSDDCHMPIRVSIFKGNNKASPLYSIKEFGNTCILTSLDKILEYGDVINLIQVDERNRKLQRNEISLFDQNAFREALINAFVHNKWIDGNAPMITIYSDRIEILSRGTLAPKQTKSGFYLGESVPVNQELSDIFLQLHISERSGRGVPKIIDIYGKNAFEFRENSIVVNIPFKYLDNMVDNVVDNVVDKKKKTQDRILEEIRNNPNITQPQLASVLSLSKTTIQNGIVKLKEDKKIVRIGSNKNGYWKVN